MEGTLITGQEVRNRKAMINGTILVGMCSEHHQHYTNEDQQIKDDKFGIERHQGMSIEKVNTKLPLNIQLKLYLLHTAQI